MNFIKQFRYGFLLAAVFLCAGTASAQGPVNGAAVTTSNLAVSATFQSALQLDIATATAGSTVGGSLGVYTLGFGNVNGLGIGTPGTNITRTSVSGGYMYTTPITLTPGFSGFAGATATVTVGQDAADDAASKSAAREGAGYRRRHRDDQHVECRQRRQQCRGQRQWRGQYRRCPLDEPGLHDYCPITRSL